MHEALLRMRLLALLRQKHVRWALTMLSPKQDLTIVLYLTLHSGCIVQTVDCGKKLTGGGYKNSRGNSLLDWLQ